MATIAQWLDNYDGPDNLVAGVARIWRAAKDEDDARPRVSAPQSVSTWLAEHRGVADESLRAAVRAYNESRGGRQATEAEVGAFRAMNSPGTIAPVPGDHEQPAGPSRRHPAPLPSRGRRLGRGAHPGQQAGRRLGIPERVHGRHHGLPGSRDRKAQVMSTASRITLEATGHRPVKIDRCCKTPDIVSKRYGVDGEIYLACDECGAQIAAITWEPPFIEEGP